MSNPEAFAHLVNAAQIDPIPPHGGSDVAWVEIWLARFPDPELTRWIVNRRPVIDPRMRQNLAPSCMHGNEVAHHDGCLAQRSGQRLFH